MDMQPKDYTVLDFRVGDFKDANGNVWCNVTFAEKHNEPIRWVVKDASKVQPNQVVYGHIEEKESKAGKSYLRFYRDQKPDNQQYFGGQSSSTVTTKPSYTPRDDNTQESIARSVALKAAVDTLGVGASVDEVLKVSIHFLEWLIRSGSTSQSSAAVPTPSAPMVTQTQAVPSAAPATGYDKARAQAEAIRQRQYEEPLPTEPQGMPFEGSNIEFDPNDIPF